jgi:hypothetical protein
MPGGVTPPGGFQAPPAFTDRLNLKPTVSAASRSVGPITE